ncbi:MAG: GGDEF domain-containing protein [Rhizobiaceae bacterium]|nr:GGDEF domain-containing protein [Rhizobiaceae bacterium]
MNGQFYFSFLNPVLGLMLASAFGILWLYQREKNYVIVIASGYAMSAMGFALHALGPVLNSSSIRVVSNMCFLASAAFLASAVIARYNRRIPYHLIGLLCAAGLGGFCWFVFFDPDIEKQIYSMNLALGAITIVAAVNLATIPNKQVIDRVLFAVSLLVATNLMVRTYIILQIAGPFDRYEDLPRSIYWSTVQVSHALISIMLALTLIVAVALDLVRQLKTESETDEMSGLLNRRGFDQAAQLMLDECAAHGRPAALVLADLDHFKAINDTYGHAVGDRVIIAFSDLLQASVNPGVIVGRIGGEEFAVAIPDTTLAGARMFAEGVRVAYGATTIPGPVAIPLTASFGVCAFDDGDKLVNLLRRADEALYSAKRDGRDRVRTFPGESGNVPHLPTDVDMLRFTH